MAYKFKGTADYYLDQAGGNDANDGTTPALAVATVGRLTQITSAITTVGQYTVRIASGHYIEDMVVNWLFTTNSVQIQVIGDGYVVFSGNNTYSLNFSNRAAFTSERITFENIVIEKFVSYGHTRNYNYENCTYNGSSAITMTGSSGGGFSRSDVKMIYNIPVNYNQTTSSSNGLTQTGCVFLADLSIPDATPSLFDCYLDRSATLTYSPRTFFLGLTNCNIRGILSFNGADFAVRDQYLGTPQDNGYPVGVQWVEDVDLETVAGIDTFVNVINRDEGFNSVGSENYSLSISSEMLNKGSSFVNIGGLLLSEDTTVENGTFNVDSTTNVSIVSNEYVIDSGFTTGTIRLSPIILASGVGASPERLLCSFTHEFNSNLPSGGTNNQNVPSVTGDKEVGLTVKVRWSTTTVNPVNDADYDNGGYITAGDFGVFQIGGLFQIDSLGRGYGDPNFDALTAFTPTLKSHQTEFILRNDW